MSNINYNKSVHFGLTLNSTGSRHHINRSGVLGVAYISPRRIGVRERKSKLKLG